MSNAKWRLVKVAGLAWLAGSTIMVASTVSALTGAHWVALSAVVAWFFGLVCFINLERRGQELRDEAARKLADEIGDVVTVAAIVASRAGIDFEQAVKVKWNKVSEGVNWKERL